MERWDAGECDRICVCAHTKVLLLLVVVVVERGIGVIIIGQRNRRGTTVLEAILLVCNYRRSEMGRSRVREELWSGTSRF